MSKRTEAANWNNGRYPIRGKTIDQRTRMVLERRKSQITPINVLGGYLNNSEDTTVTPKWKVRKHFTSQTTAKVH